MTSPTDVELMSELLRHIKVPWAGENKCAAVRGKGKDGGLQPKWPVSEETMMAKELTWKRSPYLSESLILTLIPGNR